MNTDNRRKIETLFYTIESIGYLVNNPRTLDKRLFLRPVFNNLQGPKGQDYSMTQINKILKDVFIFTESELERCSWVRIDEFGQEIKENKLNYKDFCRLFLIKIQQNPDLMNKYPWLAGFEFSDDPFDFDSSDFVLLQLFDDAMIDIFGFNNYMLLQSSVLNFGQIDGNYISDFGIHNPELLEFAAREFGLYTLDDSESEIYNTLGDYWKAIFRSWISFGFKRELVIDGELRSYIKHPPNSIFSEIFNGYNAFSTDSHYYKVINQYCIEALFSENLIPIGFQEDLAYEGITEDKALENKILANFYDEKGNLKYNYEEIEDNGYGDLLRVYELYENGKKRNRAWQDLQKGVVAETDEQIFEIIQGVYDFKINNRLDLIDKKDAIIQKIRQKYNLKPKQNVAFALRSFKMNGKSYSVFLVSISGKQFMPGTYLYYDSNNRLQIGYNPSALINAKYPAIWVKRYYALSHSERKIYITMDTLFPSSETTDGSMILVSERPFCFSCDIMGIDFFEYYHQDGAFNLYYKDPNKYYLIFY